MSVSTKEQTDCNLREPDTRCQQKMLAPVAGEAILAATCDANQTVLQCLILPSQLVRQTLSSHLSATCCKTDCIMKHIMKHHFPAAQQRDGWGQIDAPDGQPPVSCREGTPICPVCILKQEAERTQHAVLREDSSRPDRGSISTAVDTIDRWVAPASCRNGCGCYASGSLLR